jgi:anti-sigma-K factor RskA
MTDATPRLNEDDNMLAAEYALGVLQGDARASFAKRMQDSPALTQAVRQWDEHFIAFTDDIPAVTPPAKLRKSLENRLFATQQPSLWNSLNFWRGLATAAAVAVIAMGAWTLRPVEQNATSTLVANVAAAEGTFKLVAYYDNTSNELRLNRVDGAAASGRSLQLWLIAGTDAPVSLGVMVDAAQSRIAVPAALREKLKSGVLAVSDEPAGGSPTGAPTGAILATGPLTEV